MSLGQTEFAQSSREVPLWGPQILVVTTKADIDALQPVQWGWRGGVVDVRTTDSYDAWWA